MFIYVRVCLVCLCGYSVWSVCLSFCLLMIMFNIFLGKFVDVGYDLKKLASVTLWTLKFVWYKMQDLAPYVITFVFFFLIPKPRKTKKKKDLRDQPHSKTFQLLFCEVAFACRSTPPIILIWTIFVFLFTCTSHTVNREEKYLYDEDRYITHLLWSLKF